MTDPRLICVKDGKDLLADGVIMQVPSLVHH